MDKIESSVLAKIKPSPKEDQRVRHFVNELMRIARTVSGQDCVLVGSIGKGTWLAGDHDIDLFMLFPASVSRDDLEKRGLDAGKRIASEFNGTWKVKYAEHPYTHATIKGYDVDIVPCYRIARGEKIISAVDRSPLHLEYVLEHLTPAMQDEVRLLKQFCKGIGVYGSDARRLGFSGYICELLIMRYGSFAQVLQAAHTWQLPVIVDVEVQREQAERRRFDQPFVVIDPTDPGRNAAANVSAQNLLKFMQIARHYRTKPTKDLFFPKPPQTLSAREITQLRQRGTKFLAIAFPRPDVIDDVLYPQLRKSLARLETYLKYNEFLTLRSSEYAGKNVVLFLELENWSLPPIKKMVGPPIFSHKHSKEFVEKYQTLKPPKGFGPYVEYDRWIADKRREFTSAALLLKDLLRKKPDELLAIGFPSHIAASLPRARLLEDAAVWKTVRKERPLSAHLRQMYFEQYAPKTVG